jgi:hypothetical protein
MVQAINVIWYPEIFFLLSSPSHLLFSSYFKARVLTIYVLVCFL